MRQRYGQQYHEFIKELFHDLESFMPSLDAAFFKLISDELIKAHKDCPNAKPGCAVFPLKMSEIVACPQLHLRAISCWVKPLSFRFSMIFFQSMKSIYRNSVVFASGFPIFEFNRLSK
jgi:hypothetical protein